MSMLETMIVILTVLALGVTYTIIFLQLKRDVEKMIEAEQEHCPSSEDESEE